MGGSEAEHAERVRALQRRVDALLREMPADRSASRFSPYMFDEGEAEKSAGLAAEVMAAGSAGGMDGLEASVTKFEELTAREDKGRVRYELMRFLSHHPDAARLGLRLPGTEERSAWKVTPSDRGGEGI
ncbi:MAG TPA: hypothetical protein VF297_27165 [Pyrinomonadaceae bacterium]